MSAPGAYLPDGLPAPRPEPDGLSAPYWAGLARNELWVQRCAHCGHWQWGPEYLCFRCHRFDVGWERVEPTGRIFSWERPWHPVNPALNGHGPYLWSSSNCPAPGGSGSSATCWATRCSRFASAPRWTAYSSTIVTRRVTTRCFNGRCAADRGARNRATG